MKTKEAVDSFLAHCDDYLGLSPRTITTYSWGLGYLERQYEILPKSAEALERVVGVKHLSLTSRKDLKRVIGRFYGWTSKRYKFKNPFPDMEALPKSRSLPRILTDQEIVGLCDAAQTRRDRALLALPLDNGVRVGEIGNMTEWDLGPDYMMVQGKVGMRRLPLSEDVRRMMIGLGDGDRIWISRWNAPLTTWGIQQVYHRLYKRAGITGRKLGPHTLRHTFATVYVREGGNLRRLQEIMGHQSIQTTEIYLHLAGLDVKSDHLQFSPFHTLGLKELLVG